jgi:hypothetical protein
VSIGSTPTTSRYCSASTAFASSALEASSIIGEGGAAAVRASARVTFSIVGKPGLALRGYGCDD